MISRSASAQALSTFAKHPGLYPGDAWYSGDHMIFVMNQAPAIAFTAELMPELVRAL